MSSRHSYVRQSIRHFLSLFRFSFLPFISKIITYIHFMFVYAQSKQVCHIFDSKRKTPMAIDNCVYTWFFFSSFCFGSLFCWNWNESQKSIQRILLFQYSAVQSRCNIKSDYLKHSILWLNQRKLWQLPWNCSPRIDAIPRIFYSTKKLTFIQTTYICFEHLC